jgi:hypothetical protein
MQKHCVALVCTAIAWLLIGSPTAATLNELSLPLLASQSLTYLGGFRVPKESISGESFDYSGGPLAYNPARDSLFMGNGSRRVAEITIPPVVNSANSAALPYAMYLQPFADPTEGHWADIDSNMLFGGLLVYGNRLYGSGAIYYDANNIQRVSHFSRSLQLNQPSFSGWSQVWDAGKSGLVAGPMAHVPAEWQTRLGGPAVTGQCCIPIMWRTSSGPSAFAFEPTQIGSSAVAASPLVYYPSDHETLGPWAGSNPTYGATTLMGGMALIAGTRTALYFGTNGMGAHCYGDATADKTLADASGGHLCYDPVSPDKGSHAYPYRYQMWAYDLNDLAAVKAGTKSPWSVVPYGVWPLDLPTPELKVRLGGVAYDPARQILYVSQLRADQSEFAYRPVIHALRINGAPTASAPANSTVTNVAIASEQVAPQTPGTRIGFLAVSTGGTAPLQYQWSLFDGSSWAVIANWSTSNRLDWTPTGSNAYFRISVSVRGGANTVPEAMTSMPFPISSATSTARVSAVAIAADKPAPQPSGSAITWTATPTGGYAPQQYKWLVYDGASWKMLSDWSTNNTFIWTPAIADSRYRVSVWVRSAGNGNDYFETSVETPYAIGGTATTTPSPAPTPVVTPSPSTRVTAVTLNANSTAPQRVGTSITWTAVATGGVAPHQYKFVLFNGSTWIAVSGWSTSSTFVWSPTVANAGYRLAVWVRSSGNVADYFEASAERPFAIEGGTPTSSALSSVTLAASLPAPQTAGRTITWSASGSGGVAPYQFKWFIYDGATWTAAGSWSTSNTFVWTPTIANSRYRVSVWARSAGKTNDYFEASTESAFPIDGGATVSRVTAVTLGTNLIAPQKVGTTVVWTAFGSGGMAPHQFKWFVFDGTAWLAASNWSTANTFNWTPSSANSRYRVSVWVRSAGATNDYYEASGEAGFAIDGTVTAGALTGVRLTANQVSPQPAGSTVTWTAVPAGGGASPQYKWFVFDGSNWTITQHWSTQSTFTWRPLTPNTRYRVSVWVRSATSTKDYFEVSAETGFPIQ